MKNAIVIGHGMVGNATCYALGIKDYYDIEDATVDFEDIGGFRYIFICLPTPTVDGRCDTSTIFDIVSKIANQDGDNIFIIRSTVVPGTCQRLKDELGVKVVHVPEFLTEATWKNDVKHPDIVVVGGNDNKVRQKVFGIYKARYKGANFIKTNLATAETIKYAINTFYAVKVVFANQIYDFCQKAGANYETVKESMYARKWIGRNHLDVWHKGKRGAGGGCLEKDLEAFSELNEDTPFFKVADVLNKQLLKTTTEEEK